MLPVPFVTIPMSSHTLNFLLTLAKKLLKVIRIDSVLKVLAVGPGVALPAVLSLEKGAAQFRNLPVLNRTALITRSDLAQNPAL